MKAPAWVTAAVDEIDPGAELRRRIAAALPIIAAEVAPALAKLSDNGKRAIFAQAVWAGKYWQVPSTKRAREAVAEAKRLQGEIRAEAEALAGKLRLYSQICEGYGVAPGVPDFAECLRLVAQDQRFAAWALIAEVEDAARVTRATSQAVPGMGDLIECLAQEPDEPPEQMALRSAIRSRKSGADPQRVILEALALAAEHPEVPPGFRLPDAAVAALVHVIFGIDRSAHTIKMARNR